MTPARLAFGIILMAVSAMPLSGQAEILRKSFVGKAPPELVADKDHWLGGAPVTLASLRGKVVWLQFNF